MKALESCNIKTEVLLDDDGRNLNQFIAKYVEASTENYSYRIDQADIKKIVFRPRFFGMTTGDKLKYVALKTKITGPIPNTDTNMYARICAVTDNTVVGISKLTLWAGVVDTLVSFEFNPISFSSVDDKYYIEFLNSDETVRNVLGVRLNLLDVGQVGVRDEDDPDYYSINRPSTSEVEQKRWRPICFFNILHDTSFNNAYIIQNNNIKNSKLNSTSFAPEFDQTSSYYIGSRVSYNGNIYTFIRDHIVTGTLNAWNTNDVSVVNMSSPDATLNILANGGLCLQDANNAILWQEGYDLSTTASVQLKNWTVNYYEFDSSSPSATVFLMPTTIPGKMVDFVLDVKNTDSSNKKISLSNDLSITMCAVVQESSALSDVLTISANEMAELSFTQTAFLENNLPVYKITKNTVNLGGAEE